MTVIDSPIDTEEVFAFHKSPYDLIEASDIKDTLKFLFYKSKRDLYASGEMKDVLKMKGMN